MNTFQFPARNPSLTYPLSIIIVVLMTAMSLAGILFQFAVYPTDELRRSFVSNDVVNLFIGLPILLGSMALARKGKLIGLLFWPGALLYITYNYIAYTIAMPFTLQFATYLTLVVLSSFSVFRLVSGIDATVIQQRLTDAVQEKFTGGVLVGFGVLFFLMRISVIVQAFSGKGSQVTPQVAVAVADVLTMPLWVIGGILLWRKKGLGYISGAGLLFQASMLFVGLLVFFILQPFLTETPFPLNDFIVIFVMGLVCFIPFGLFVRGVVSRDK